MQIFKLLAGMLVFTIGHPCLAQQGEGEFPTSKEAPRIDSCDLLVSADSAFASISVMEEATKPKPVEVSIKFQIDNNEPCEMEGVTPLEIFFPEKVFEIRVSRKEGESNLRFFLNDKRGFAKAWSRHVVRECARVNDDWQFTLGCSGF